MNPSFRIGEAVSYGWRRALANWKVLSAFVLVVAAADIVLSYFISQSRGQLLPFLVFEALNLLVSFYLAVSAVRISLIEADGRQATWRDVWSRVDLTYWRFIGAAILLIVIMGAIALVAGTIAIGSFALMGQSAATSMIAVAVMAVALIAWTFLSIRLRLSAYAVIAGEPNTTVWGSIAESWRITRGNFWRLLGFYIVVLLVNVLGAIVFVVGLLITIPLTIVATAHVYRQLRGSESPEVPAVETPAAAPTA